MSFQDIILQLKSCAYKECASDKRGERRENPPTNQVVRILFGPVPETLYGNTRTIRDLYSILKSTKCGGRVRNARTNDETRGSYAAEPAPEGARRSTCEISLSPGRFGLVGPFLDP